nr:unnamed protein product [Callosobruchus analis]
MLKEEFDSRFLLSGEDKILFKFAENPFSVDANEMPTALQLELIDLQCSDLHKEKHRDGNLLEFYKCLDKNKFPNIIDTAQQILCLFGNFSGGGGYDNSLEGGIINQSETKMLFFSPWKFVNRTQTTEENGGYFSGPISEKAQSHLLGSTTILDVP